MSGLIVNKPNDGKIASILKQYKTKNLKTLSKIIYVQYVLRRIKDYFFIRFGQGR